MTTLTPERIEELATALRRFATTEHGKRFRLHADIMRLVFSDPLSLADALSRDGMREALVKAAAIVTGWREVDWPEGFDRRTAEIMAEDLARRIASLSPDAPRQKVE